MNSELGIRNSELGKCHPERNAVRRGVEGSIRLVGALVALVMTFFTACTDYQEQFDNNFAALEYGDIENPELSSGVVPGSSGGSTTTSSASVSSGAEPLSSGTVPASSGVGPLSSGAIPASSGAEPQYSETVPPQSSGEQPSSSAGSSSSEVGVSCKVTDGDCFEDSRDNKTYRTVQLLNQVWMAENLNYDTLGSYLPDTSKKYSELYGRFYTWESAKNACPKGWHLPSEEEFGKLIKYVGSDGAQSLRSKSGWNKECEVGADGYGFAAFPAGHMQTNDNTYFLGVGRGVHFWNTSDYGDEGGTLTIGCESNVIVLDSIFKYYAVSVRCIKGEPLSSSSVNSSSSSVKSSSSVSSSSFVFESSGNYTDPRTNQDFKYVKYKGLVWMDQDLNYREPDVQYTPTKSNGTVYSWENAKKACPPGWRLPTIDEFNKSESLESYSTLNGNEPGARLGFFLMTLWHDGGDEGMYWLSPSTSSSSYDYLYAVQFNKVDDEGTVVHIDKNVAEGNTGAVALAVRCVTGTLSPNQWERSSSSTVYFSRKEIPYSNSQGSQESQDSPNLRDYTTVTIGNHEWMAQNLQYYDNLIKPQNEFGMRCLDKGKYPGGCDDNGVYYDYETANQIASIAKNHVNNGKVWTLPGRTEAQDLLTAVENNPDLLMSPAIGGTNQAGFYVLNSGYFPAENEDHEGGKGTCFWLWSGTSVPEKPYALCFHPEENNFGRYQIEQRSKNSLFPIRLVYTTWSEQ